MTESTDADAVAGALSAGTREAFERLLTDDVHWHAECGSGPSCHSRREAGEFYGGLLANGAGVSIVDASRDGDDMVLRLSLTAAGPDALTVRLRFRDGLIAEIVELDAGVPIEMLYVDGCPHHDTLLAHLRPLLSDNDIRTTLTLIRVDTDEDAQRLRFLGSPTVRIDGHDVEAGANDRQEYGLMCRIYHTAAGVSGLPPEEWILDALAPGRAAHLAVGAVRAGDTTTLQGILDDHPDLATARLPWYGGRTLLHVATDWPGHRPNVVETIRVLVGAGADPDAAGPGPHPETPLHWAASSNDIAALDALLDAGADIDVPGAVIGGGPPLADATAFGQWEAAHRLVERGAAVDLWAAATLGLVPQLRQQLDGRGHPGEQITSGFWGACHGGHLDTAIILLDHGADINWIGYDSLTPLDAARRSDADDVIAWLLDHGAVSASQLG